MSAFSYGRKSFGTKRKSKSKYGAVKTAGGYGSKLESAVNDMLLLREKSLEITDIQRQQTIVLQGGPRETRITIRIDFTAVNVKTGETFAVEAKGFATRDYVLKLKMWRMDPPMALEVWGGHYQRLKLLETIAAKESDAK